MSKKNISLILLAGGQGKRFNNSTPKQFLELNGIALSLFSYNTFLSIKDISEIIIVCDKPYQNIFSQQQKPIKFASPGKRRQDSLYNGVKKLSSKADFVCIHDAARPFVTKEEINILISTGIKYHAAALGIPLVSTIKKIDRNNFVKTTVNRNEMWEIQTPQILSLSILKKGLALAIKNSISVTDDISLAELLGLHPKIVLGKKTNYKITFEEDFLLAKSHIKQ